MLYSVHELNKTESSLITVIFRIHGETNMIEMEKKKVLKHLSGDLPVAPTGRAKYRIKDNIVHVRFCSLNRMAPTKFKFNINPNTLCADFELWICGSFDCYYLMPTALLKAIYQNPNTYIDRRHAKIRIVSVDTAIDTVTYATGGQYQAIREYRQAMLKPKYNE